jgi:ADP-heptose:LPS heptosyltransferase
MHQTAIDLVGQTADFGQLAALLEHAHLYAGNDSSPLHLAVAVGTPVVGVFGPTDPALTGPYDANAISLVAPDACSQTRRFAPGPLTACLACRCIQRVTVDEVWSAAERQIAAAALQSRRQALSGD